jgi:hypothetical protein
MSESQFTELEYQEFQSYRPANLWALGSLVVAFASALSLIHPLLSVVALIAVLLAIIALLPSRAEGWGRPVALMALAVAVFFPAWGNAQFFYRRAILYEEAHKNGDAWLALMAKKQHLHAHQLTCEHWERAGPGASLEEHYKEPVQVDPDHVHDPQQPRQSVLKTTPAHGLKAFLEGYPVSRLLELSDFEFHFVRVDSYTWSVKEEKFHVRYTVTSPELQSDSFYIRLVMIRAIENRVAYWRIDNVGGEVTRGGAPL